MLVVLALPSAADELSCATSPAVTKADAERAAWAAARTPFSFEKALAKTATSLTPSVNDHVVIMGADELVAPFRNPIDLHNKTIDFRRIDSESFEVTTGPLNFDDDRGRLVTLHADTLSYKRIGFTHFNFPFYDRWVHSIYIAENNAIYLEPPSPRAFRQYGELELATDRTAVISPLLFTANLEVAQPQIWFKETYGALTITWAVDQGAVPYEVQAVLMVGGDIRFSYRNVKDARAGAVLVTSGTEAWRQQRELLGEVTDVGAADIPMLDVQTVDVNRIAGSDLVEFRIELAEEILREKIPNQLVYSLLIGERTAFTYNIRRNGFDDYTVPGWGTVPNTPAARFEGRFLYLYALQGMLPVVEGETSIRLTCQHVPAVPGGDVVRMSASFSATSTRRPEVDFSTASRTIMGDRLVGEAFTVPPLSVHAVWDRVRQTLGLETGEWSGVAIYTNFPTDISFFADAYSTGGNPGADGVTLSPQAGARLPLTPALMHMNRVLEGRNRMPLAAGQVLLHEFGHHWLSSIAISENGAASLVLNPAGAHPAQYVDTRAAFSLFGKPDSSPMGGGRFDDHGGGQYLSTASPYAFSWLDLYLMGLADKREVPPFFYLSQSYPPLGEQYFPPTNERYRAESRQVTIDQVTEAMGTRVPSFARAPKRFRALFVLVAAPERVVTSEELAAMSMYRRLLTEQFNTATGGRGEVLTTYAPPSTGPRRRAR
jgi:hypothetical protein